MLRFTRITGGEAGLNYLLSGSGCESAKLPKAEQELSGGTAYFAQGTERGAPLATWIGAGVQSFGLSEGDAATERDIRVIFGKHAHPEEYRAAMAAALAKIEAEGLSGTAAEKLMAEAERSARLGRKPYEFRTVEDRVEARLAQEPNAEPERIAEIRREERDKGQSAPAMYFDATFSAQKSVSVYHTALEAAGRLDDAAKVKAAHHEGIRAATEYLQQEAGYGRIGYHGQAKGDRPTTGRYVDGHEWTAAVFDHGVSREGDPQMHSHVAILNKIKVLDEDGNERWVTLDSRAMNKARAAAAAIYERTMEQAIERDTDVVFEMRPDGLAREIKGFDEPLLNALSTRSFQVDERYQELLTQYVEDHGREPSALVKTRLKEIATLDTRDPKRNEHQDAAARIERTERLAAQAFEGGLTAALDKAEATGVRIRQAESGEVEWDRETVITEALETLQTKRSTWDRSALIQQLNTTLGDQLPRDIPLAPLANELADEALKSGRYGIVQTAGLTIIDDAPSRIRTSDGRSIFGPGQLGAERFALEERLTTEDMVASRAHQTGAPCLSPTAIALVVSESGVTQDQADVVRGVLGDSKRISVVEGPAGAGKSYATGVVAAAWHQHTGGRVIGLGPSQVAAEVLGEEGIELRTNTTRFLDFYAEGLGSQADVERFRIRSGDLVVLDEAGMTSTSDIARLTRIVEQAGGKLVLIGDQQQLQSVEAGGLFRTMVEDGPHYSLSNVRRFKDQDGTTRQWEADASLALRRGDIHALEEYDRRGLIMGGTLEEMKGAAIRAYVADTIRDRESVIITGTNARATEVSREIRRQLVWYGRVQEEGTPLADDNRAGIGDLIQTRENDAKLRDSEGRMVLNRRVYRVTGRDEHGQLTARRVAGRNENGSERLGGVLTLPAEYVQTNVALAYAGTVHAVQGRTVGYGGYLLAEEGMTREQVYPGLTRATRYNRAFAVCEVAGDEHRLEPLHQDPMGLLQAAVKRDGGELSALQELRESQDWAESVPALEPRWRDYVTEHTRALYEPMLRQMLSPEHFDQLKAGDPSTVYRKLREAELAGHAGPRLLSQAIHVRPMTFPPPENVAALVNWRIDVALQNRTPESEPAGDSWADRTPDIPGIEGLVARELAGALDERRDVLGERLTEETPEWAARHLGPVPEDALERAEWARRAGTVEAYRELYGIEAPNTAIGGVPARGAVEQRAAWEAAHKALGRTDDDRTLATTDTAVLREMKARYDREQSWAPAHVGEELSEARQAELRYAERAILAQAEADQEPHAERRAELEEEARGYEELVGTFGRRVEALETIDAARTAWYEETAPVREAAEAAREELQRRDLDDQVEAQPDVVQGLDEDLTAEPEYDADRMPELDWAVEGETLDQAPEAAVEPEQSLSRAEQEELDQVLAAYEERYRAATTQAPEVDWAVEGETLDQAPEAVVEEVSVEPAPEHEADLAGEIMQAEVNRWIAEQAARERREAVVQAPEVDWEVEGETYEQRPEAEPEYDLDEVPAIDWEVEGETYEQRPEPTAEAEAAVEQPEQTAAAVPSVEDQYRELYEAQYAQKASRAPAVETERLPAALADLQEDLEAAQHALAEVAARRAEREIAALAEETARAEQAEADRVRQAEAQAAIVPQIEQDGPTISYDLPE
ncbi:MobF family relaxase [Streptomyces sp. NBUL23]|uniref:MobF family relaxase n=1 Tax=Streptomyces sp. NBUL23 TaxID=3381354 RepID=UPI003872286E